MVTKPSQDTSHEAAESSRSAVTADATSVNDAPAAQQDPAENALPAAIIAQAESAIYGQFEPDDMPAVERRKSRAAIRQNAPTSK
jgi:hypothetical protein